MSVINRMLKDLDRQGDKTPAPVPGVHSVAMSAQAQGMRWAGFAIGLAILGLAAWWFWPAGTDKTLPPGETAALPEAPAPAPPAPMQPQLRLSQELDAVPPPPPVPPKALPATPMPARAEPTTKPSATVAPRLETRLPEALSATTPPAAPPKPLVIKEIKPQTPADQAEDLWRQASRLVEQGRGRDAQARLEQVLQLDPSHLRARQTLVVLALEGERSAAAEALLRQGMALHPGEAWFPRSLAQLHIQQGAYAQAASVLKASLGKGSEAADWGLYAGTLAKMGRSEETAAAYREALRRDASQGPWWIGLGLALEQTGHRPEAAEAFGRALQTHLAPELKEFAARKAQDL